MRTVAVRSLFGVAFLAVHIDALAPAHTNNTSWESVHARRNRLSIRYDYRPRHVSDEHCRFLTEEQCQADDEVVAISKKKRLLTSTGKNIRVLVVLCRFSDHTNRQLPDRTYFETLFNGKGPSAVNPVGSIREWLFTNSLGRYNGKLSE